MPDTRIKFFVDRVVGGEKKLAEIRFLVVTWEGRIFANSSTPAQYMGHIYEIWFNVECVLKEQQLKKTESSATATDIRVGIC